MTNEEKQELLNAIRAESTDVSELDVATSLDGVGSLPAMQGGKMVSVPIDLLSKPATDAATAANTAASAANAAATAASSAAQEAATAAGDANSAATLYGETAEAGLHGATARFAGVVESATVLNLSMTSAGGEIVYVRSAKKFAYRYGNQYYGSWSVEGMPTSLLYKSPDFSTVAKNKVYVTGQQLYAWSDADGDLVQIGGTTTSSSISYEIIQ